MKAPTIAVVVIVVAAAGLGLYYYSGYSVTPIQPAAQEQQPAGTTTGSTALDAAKEMQSFIDSRRTADGFYKYSYNCETGLETDCGLDEVYQTTNAWTSYSNLALYRATGEQKYLDNAKRDADKVIEWCGEPANNRMCSWILVQISELYEETGEGTYLDFLTSQGETLLNLDDITDPEVDFQRNSTMMFGIEARELAAIYQINNDQSYLDAAKVRIERAYGNTPDSPMLYQFNGNGFRDNSCWPELANVEVYAATNDEVSLAQARGLLDTFDPAVNVVYMDYLTNIQPCAELYSKVYGATGDAKYNEGAVGMSKYVLMNRWDTAGNVLVSGSGAVLSNSYSKVDTLTDAAYMVVILSGIKDSEVLA